MKHVTPFSSPSWSAWVAVALGLSLAGCTSPKVLGDECLFNADCADPLICSARRCRAQCASDRDCPRGELCANAGQAGKKVCFRPESALLCAFPSDCSPTSTCSAGLCHAVCASDGECVQPPASNTCDTARMLCREPDRVTARLSVGDGGDVDGGDALVDAAVADGAAVDAGVTPDAVTLDAGVVDVGVLDAVDVVTADAVGADVAALDVSDATSGDVVDVTAMDAVDVAVADVASADVRDVVDVVDVGDVATLLDGGMVCLGAPDLRTDLDNCGRCGNRCPRPSAGTGTVACVAGVCRATCAAGYSDCNGLCTDLRSDRGHCGVCGNVCEVACNAGVCLNPVEIVANWGGGALVRLTDNTWRGFGQGSWASETDATPAVFPWAGYREVPSPIAVDLTGQDLIFASPGRLYRVTSSGTLQGLGSNGGALGDGTTTSRTRWVDIPGLTGVRDATGSPNGIYSIGCAAYGTDGRVACWGSALAYAQGNPRGADRTQPDPAFPVLRFDDQPLVGVTQVRRGTSFSLALRDNGEVWSWGVNGDGRLGLGYTAPTDYAAQARRIPTLPPCTAIAAGLEFGCALDNTGALWCWGRNDVGQVGDGTSTNRNVPTRVVTADPTMPSRDIPLTDVIAVATTYAGACAITSTRALYCWGNNLVGQAGVDVAGNVPRATRVPAPPGVATLRVQSVSLSDNYGCLLTVAETVGTVVPPRVYCWGYEGTLGYPASGRTRAPTRPVFW